MHLTSIEFRQFRGLADYRLGVDDFNVLVGPNNSGKSTIVSALRLLASAIQHARSRRPTEIAVGDRRRQGYWLNEQGLPTPLDNIHTELARVDTEVGFRFGSGRVLTIHFPAEGGCCLLLDPMAPVVDSPAAFKRHYAFKVAVLPVLTGLEGDEQILTREHVRSSIGTPRAPRHFRNFWWHYPDRFVEFREFLLRTWPEVSDVLRPTLPEPVPPRLVMFCIEDGQHREIQWAGFGFQVWCQLLTHLLQARDADLIVIDEPEIYLHADLQRRLVHTLRELGTDILLATHSAEIISEVEASDIVIVDKRRSAGKRTSSPSRTRSALASVGSSHNIILSGLVRTRHALFLEGEDFKILRRWARVLGLDQLAAGVGMVTFPYGGFPSPDGLRELCRGIAAAVGEGERLIYAGVFDRDYRSDDAVDLVEDDLRATLAYAHILYRKEIENYLLIPKVLDRAMATEVARRRERGGVVREPRRADDILWAVTDEFRAEIESLYIGARLGQRGPTAEGQQSRIGEEFARRWSDLGVRLCLVPGKRAFSRYLESCQDEFGFSLSTTSVLASFRRPDIPFEIAQVLRELDAFRAAPA
jgi:energy-coupling factor transporter ATP-binding protein EcfA2